MTDEQRQMVRWHLKRAQIADHAVMGERYRVQARPIEDVPVPPFTDKGEAQQWFREERRNLVSLTAFAAQNQWHFETWALAEAMWAYFTTGGQYEDAEYTYRLAAEAAEEDANPVAQIRMMLLLGQTLTDALQFTEAGRVLTDTLAAAERLGDHVLIGTALEFNGRLELKRERYATALAWFERATANAHKQIELGVGTPRVLGLQLWFLAQSRRGLGELDLAAELFEQARDQLALANDWRTGVMVEIEAALLALRTDVDGAAGRVEDALGLAHDLGIALPLAQGRHQFALLSAEPERTEHLEKALALYESIGDAGADEVRKLLGR
ncbi:tetratricopeptide repeat protein [Glycomyces sp. NRRL B-16210]|uniref:tetratricopeptide repeat protein n=1 Tax=Glycomyces sp. NRRL B-16210 TaxID=1463821 RepID=UPI0004C17D2F|nr:tetratricopeptide repeat protein [Glycomyces sp. NRRL B-16210]